MKLWFYGVGFLFSFVFCNANERVDYLSLLGVEDCKELEIYGYSDLNMIASRVLFKPLGFVASEEVKYEYLKSLFYIKLYPDGIVNSLLQDIDPHIYRSCKFWGSINEKTILEVIGIGRSLHSKALDSRVVWEREELKRLHQTLEEAKDSEEKDRIMKKIKFNEKMIKDVLNMPFLSDLDRRQFKRRLSEYDESMKYNQNPKRASDL